MSPPFKQVVPRGIAWRDIEAASDHYETYANLETAHAFLVAVEGAFDHIARHPASGSPRYAHALDLPDLRSWPLKRFPYLVFYMECDDHIDVWRVLHQERDVPVRMGEGP